MSQIMERLRPGLLYSPRHTWARKVGKRRVRVGLDPFASDLIGQALSIVFPAIRSRIDAGKPGCWVLDETGPIPIRMPVSGTVVRCHKELQQFPGPIGSEPCGRGWLMEVEVEGERATAGLIPPEAMAPRMLSDLERFRRRIGNELRRSHAAVGPTLMDGGEPVDDLRRALGPSKYRRLILEFL
ncbi:MAG TPA: glycine cleavage system protein H [Bdellovibrionota bacterium]|nr:glycine cleavage system protein H [Bdellovibrionota bacterium]